MAPAAIMETSTESSPNISRNSPGLSLETTSDAIDQVNYLKASLQGEEDVITYAGSQFDAHKDKSQFRQYSAACERVKGFYREQHTKQTVAYNLWARNEFASHHTPARADMTIWQAMEKLNMLIDDSDPDTSLSQIEHLLQSAEAIRRDGQPRWFQLTGLIHDLGKLLFFYGARGQWDVVGDTFPVGCAFEDSVIYADTFTHNPDTHDPIYSTPRGIYTPGCGLDNVMISWGHDEYLYRICKRQSTLPDEALAMIRYHSFYAWHSGGGYRWLMDEEKDPRMLAAVRAFNPYDLYSKSDGVPDVEVLKPYYLDLINEYFPPREGEEARAIRW